MRILVNDFSLSNEIYAGATVTFYTVDANGDKTSTKATLYAALGGTTTLGNPQTLDGLGKFSQPVYTEDAVIAVVTGLTVPDHETGVINADVNWLGAWATSTIYAANDIVSITASEDADKNGSLYICTERHTSGTFATDRDTNLYWDLFIDASVAADWANKVDGSVDGSEYSAKAYAVGGTGVDDVAGKGSAKAWATEAEDSTVDGSEYSAKHYSAKASASATLAEAAANGIYWKQPAECVATSNITLSGEQTIDGVTTSTSRVLVTGQTASEENGVYVSAAGAWARATPLDTWDEHIGACLNVTRGTTYADTQWLCTVDPGGTLGTTAITWGQRAQGDMKKSENLSGLADQAAARGNIGLLNSGGTDNNLTKQNGTTGQTQTTGITVDDDDNLYGQGHGVVDHTTTSLTLTASHNGKVIYANNASAITITLPETATEAIAKGFQCTIIQEGAGQVSFATEGSDTLISKSSLTSLNAQYSMCIVTKRTAGSPNTWYLGGDLG